MISKYLYSKIEGEANKLISDHLVTAAPVDVFNLIKTLDIDLIEYNLGEETSGVLLVENGKGAIGVNPKDPLVRRRFTAAHELGHYILHRVENHFFVDNYFLIKYRKNNSYTAIEYKQEQEANAFAAALLMPESFINEALSQENLRKLDETEFIGRLAKRFVVSVPAMSLRLTNMNIFP